MSDMKREQFGVWMDIPVRWGDVDRLGHVNNVQYFRYCEDARTTWVEQLTRDAGDIWGGGQGPIVAEIQCLFLQQLHHPATISIGTRVVRIGRSSIQLVQALFVSDNETPVATSESRIVWFDYGEQKSVPVPEDLRKRIRAIEPIAPQEG